jgi:hypothetical protein
MPDIYVKTDQHGETSVVVMGNEVATDQACCCGCDQWDNGSDDQADQHCTSCDETFANDQEGPFQDPHTNQDSDVIFVVTSYNVDDDVAINGDILDDGTYAFTDTGTDACPGSGEENGAHTGAQHGYCFYISASEIVQIDWLNHFRGNCFGSLSWETWAPTCYGDPNFPYDGYGCG